MKKAWKALSWGKKYKQWHGNRILLVQMIVGFLFGSIIFRLFFLQVVEGQNYAEIAREQRISVIEIPARRGEILVKDKNTSTMVKMATNTTLDLLYIDPAVTPDPRIVADALAPLLYTDADFLACQKDPEQCPRGSVITESNSEDGSAPKLILPKKDIAEKAFAEEIFQKIQQKWITMVIIGESLSGEQIDALIELKSPGVEVIREQSLVFLDPTKLPTAEAEKRKIALQIADILEQEPNDILKKMALRENRYVRIQNKIRPEISEKIEELKRISRETHESSKAKILSTKSKEDPLPDVFRGVVLIPEHWRYYPDNEIASHILGFVNHENTGQYGIEGKFDHLLSGISGKIESELDVSGRGVSPSSLKNAADGASIVLTIDRMVQKKVEEVLEKAVADFRADSGQIVVLEPKTGKIIAMANAPRFNPNAFGEAFALQRTSPEMTKEIFKTTPLFTKDEHNRWQHASFEDFENAWKESFDPEFFVYKNRLGPGVFINRAVQESYEPGSVFKPLVMAAALEVGEIRPETTYNEDGPVKVGDFLIRTATEKYNGIQTMTNILETSSNVGMVFVALRLGKSVIHSFITEKFHFGDYTDVDLDQETAGKILPKKDWSDAHLLTASFGQGLTVTPLQMARAWGALANSGVVMRPQILEEIIFPDGRREAVAPEEVGRAISPDTATTITAMLISSTEKGVARTARIPGYRVAGKTGTSQIAGPNGKYEVGDGAFITSFGGYAPANNPRFVVIVKFDRPRLGVGHTWGENTAAPVFAEVMSYLLSYFDVPPE